MQPDLNQMVTESQEKIAKLEEKIIQAEKHQQMIIDNMATWAMAISQLTDKIDEVKNIIQKLKKHD